VTKRQKPVKVPRTATERLVLRQLSVNDVKFIYDLFSLEETNHYVSNPPVKDMGEARKIFELYCRPKPTRFRLGIALKEGGELIGTLGLYAIDLDNRRAILGFDLLPKYWGKGYMAEAVNALLDYAFGKLKLNRISASAEPDNKRSLAVMRRCGFRKEGVLRQLDYYKGAYHDDVVYSILSVEWKKTRK
jgi:ribosomal-protein-alanine N-acetyltransferase